MAHDDQSAPLLPEHDPQSTTTYSATSETTVGQTYVRHAVHDSSAWIIQAGGLAFLALVWGLVLSCMPLRPLPLFGYHPMIQSFAFLLLLQGILTLQPTSHADGQDKGRAFQVHRFINLVMVLPLFTIGASIMWYLHDQPNAKHFISWHGILGTAVVVWMWIQVAIGIAITANQGRLVGGQQQAKALWRYHRLSGYLLLPAFVLVLFLGANHTSWAQTNGNGTYRWATTVVLLGTLAALLYRTRWTKITNPAAHR